MSGGGSQEPHAQFKLIGRRDIGRSNVPLKVNGSAICGIDVQVPGMVYAWVMQSPMEGAKPKDINVPDVMKVKGVTKVIPSPSIAVITDTVEATRSGVQALKSLGHERRSPAASFNSDKAKSGYAAQTKDPDVDHQG